jgi:hypothetical protein
MSMVFRDWPTEQVLVLMSLLRSSQTVKAALNMAHDEMQTITDLDVDLLREHRDEIRLYFAEHDDWVGDQRDAALESFDGPPDAVRVVHGSNGVPHAFCIREFRSVEWVSILTF